MKIALLGYSGSGKTTIVSALAGKRHESFDPLKPVLVSVKIHDSRLKAIADIVKPQKTTEPEITFVDFKGPQKSTGFDEKVIELAILQDKIALVVPFYDERNSVDELGSLYLEMVYRDQERVKNILEKRKQEILHGKRKKGWEEEILEKCINVLEQEKLILDLEIETQKRVFLGSLGLITTKRFFVIVNGKPDKEVEQACQAYGLRFCYIDAQNFDKTQLEFFWNEFLKAAGLVRFYTIVGKETRAWLLPEGSTVLDAAATIHTDIAAGFVRADVVKYVDFVSLGSFSACREKGLLKSESKTGIVNDGDIIHIHSTR
ncbi:MAG: DUF933 domain-containing protein [Candidatus Omnitrophica bacterium]|nr:DUF933 domain-containing protein [Candidatus Omnitrophota bacterium]